MFLDVICAINFVSWLFYLDIMLFSSIYSLLSLLNCCFQYCWNKHSSRYTDKSGEGDVQAFVASDIMVV